MVESHVQATELSSIAELSVAKNRNEQIGFTKL